MQNTTSLDRFRSLLVIAATIGTIAVNYLASAGYLSGVTPAAVSDQYQTGVTPANYAFTVWNLIYLGLIGFSILQALPRHVERFSSLRSPYIASCAVNCIWIYFWQSGQIAICFALIVLLAVILTFIVARIEDTGSVIGSIVTRGTFGLYLGWVISAAIINFAAMLAYLNVGLGAAADIVGALLLIAAAGFGIAARVALTSYVAPLAVAWALTAVAVKQSGKTLIVSAAAIGVVACLIAAFSFVLSLKDSNEQR